MINSPLDFKSKSGFWITKYKYIYTPLTIYKDYNYFVKLKVFKTEKRHADIETLS